MLNVPGLNDNLFLVRADTQKGYIVQFGRNRCWLKNHRSMVVAKRTVMNKLYILDLADVNHIANVASSVDIWHLSK